MGHQYPPPTRFKINRIYSVQEIATTGGVCENTVHNWRKAGLQAIDARRPIYVSGSEMRRFLTEKRHRLKSPCQIDELFCLKCRKPQRPYDGLADFLDAGKTGRLTGLCPVCTSVMHKCVSLNDMPMLETKLQIQHIAHIFPAPPAASQEKVEAALKYYTQEASKVLAGPNLFGETTNAKDIIATAGAKAKSADAGPNLFDEPMAEFASANSLREGAPDGRPAGTRGPDNGKSGDAGTGGREHGGLNQEIPTRALSEGDNTRPLAATSDGKTSGAGDHLPLAQRSAVGLPSGPFTLRTTSPSTKTGGGYREALAMPNVHHTFKGKFQSPSEL